MTISYPLSLPNTNFKRLTMRANTVVAISRSPFTFQSQTYEHAGAIWIAEVTLPIMSRADAEAWTCFLLKLNGPYGTFLLGDPSAKTPQGSPSGSPQVDGDNPAGKILPTKGWTPSTSNLLKAGDYIQIENHLYKNLTDVTSDGSGNANLDIWPRLKDGYADGTSIVTSNCVGTFRLLQTDFPIYSADEAKNYEVSFTAIEDSSVEGD